MTLLLAIIAILLLANITLILMAIGALSRLAASQQKIANGLAGLS